MSTLSTQLFVTGLVDVGLRFKTVNGDWDGARVTANITEGDDLKGTYHATSVTVPATAKSVFWNSAATLTAFAEETFDTVGYATLGEALSGTHGAGSWEGSGGGGISGPNSITVTWLDENSDPVPLVEFTVVGQGSGRSDVSGVATFGLADGTYTISSRVTSGVIFANTALVVNGTETLTITGTSAVIPGPPADVSLCNVFGYLETVEGIPAADVPITFVLVAPGVTASERLLSGREITVRTDKFGQIVNSRGQPYVSLQRNDLLDPDDTTWEVTCPFLNLDAESITLDTTTFNLLSVV